MQSSDRTSATAKLLRVLEVLAWTAYFTFAAVFLALRFWLLPQVEHRQAEVVAALTRVIGLPVTISALRAEWDGLRPRLVVAGLRIYDRDGREALALPSVEPVVSWATIPALQLRLHSLIIDGPRLLVRRDAQGALHVAGLGVEGQAAEAQAEAGGTGAGMAAWILAQREIEIRNAEIEWRDELRGAPPLVLRNLQFRLRNRGDLHQVGLSAQPPRVLGASLELRAAVRMTEVNDPASWAGRAYAEFGYTDLAAWKPWVDYPVDVASGDGALRVWASFGEGRVLDAKADLALGNVVARLGRDLPVLAITSVNGRVEGRQIAGGYEFGVRRLARVMPSGGRIVCTASLAGLTAVPDDPVYALTKHAVVGFVRSAAGSLARRGISINAVCPGFADTPMVAGVAREALEGGGFPLLSAAEVAEAAWVALESGETGHAWVVQPGRPPLDFRFPTLPGPRTASDEQVGMPPPLA